METASQVIVNIPPDIAEKMIKERINEGEKLLLTYQKCDESIQLCVSFKEHRQAAIPRPIGE